MDLPAIFLPDVAEGGGNATFRHHGVGLPEQRLADERCPSTVCRGLDRRAQPGPAGADNDDVILVALVASFPGHQNTILGSEITPEATRRT
jgi:hypothetical protein